MFINVNEELLNLLKWLMQLTSVLHKFGIVQIQFACIYTQNRVQIFISVRRDLFLDLFTVMHENVCSQIYVEAKNTHIFLANFFKLPNFSVLSDSK